MSVTCPRLHKYYHIESHIGKETCHLRTNLARTVQYQHICKCNTLITDQIFTELGLKDLKVNDLILFYSHHPICLFCIVLHLRSDTALARIPGWMSENATKDLELSGGFRRVQRFPPSVTTGYSRIGRTAEKVTILFFKLR